MNILPGAIKGKQVNKFPVYLRKETDSSYTIVVTNLNDVSRLPKDTTWINAGVAPGDRNRAVLGSTPTSSISVTKSFEVHRIISREGNTFKLYPEGTFSPSVTWIQSNRPRPGGYLLRHDADYYTAMTDKTFDRHYGKNLDPQDRKNFKAAMEAAMPEPDEQLGEVLVESGAVAVANDAPDDDVESVGNC